VKKRRQLPTPQLPTPQLPTPKEVASKQSLWELDLWMLGVIDCFTRSLVPANQKSKIKNQK